MASVTSHPLWQIPPEVSMRLRSRLQATCVLMAFATLSAAASQPVVEVFLPASCRI